MPVVRSVRLQPGSIHVHMWHLLRKIFRLFRALLAAIFGDTRRYHRVEQPHTRFSSFVLSMPREDKIDPRAGRCHGHVRPGMPIALR